MDALLEDASIKYKKKKRNLTHINKSIFSIFQLLHFHIYKALYFELKWSRMNIKWDEY